MSAGYRSGQWLWSKAVHEIGDWFGTVVEHECPELVVIHQSRYAWLVASCAAPDDVTRVLDAPEPQSAGDALWGRVADVLGDFPVDVAEIPEQVLDRLAQANGDPGIDRSELAGYERFDRVLLMNRSEAAWISQRVGSHRARWTPHTMAVVRRKPTYHGPAIFLMAANPHNVAGLAWFVRRVLPIVQAAAPDFRLVVAGAGSGCVRLPDNDAITLRGKVQNLSTDLYATARLAICPVFTGNGQPVKLLESLAHRVPVVAVGAAARRAGLTSGDGCLVADDASLFARAVLKLWRNPPLARRIAEGGAQWMLNMRSANLLSQALAGP